MDKRKVEQRLADFAREFGFTLPDGSFPESTFFSQLVATPLRCHLWETVLNKLQPKDKIQKIRKQILLAKLKSDATKGKPQNYVSGLLGPGVESKIDLWKKKGKLEQQIIERKKQVDELRDNIYKRAQSIQSEACKVAEIEKRNADLKEKLLLSNILIGKHKKAIEEYKELVKEIKSLEMNNPLENIGYNKDKVLNELDEIEKSVIEELGDSNFELDEQKIQHEIDELITNRNCGNRVWEILLGKKNGYLKRQKDFLDELGNEENTLGGRPVSLSLLEEEIMLKITENSLQAVQNMTLKKVEELHLKEILTEIENCIHNKSPTEEPSFLCENGSGDYLRGQSEKMSMLLKALDHFGLTKRLEFLTGEVERIVEENKKNEHWTAEKEKFEKEALTISKQLDDLKEEGERLTSLQKISEQSVLRKHKELVSSINEINKEFTERNIFEKFGTVMKEIGKEVEKKFEAVREVSLDAFRKIQTDPAREAIPQWESLPHCLDNYGGELKELFCSLLISPYKKPEAIVETVKTRGEFLSFINEVSGRNEDGLKNAKAYLSDGAETLSGAEATEKNYKTIMRVLEKILNRGDVLSERQDVVKRILKSWLEQPYRHMIPDDITVNSMTLRQFEEKYQAASKEIQYYGNGKEAHV
ncbi:UNVERIFIED_CONTAM: hypothetical protein PYX00_010175 [Menopon gallinae]|uniref:Uncharacterized protein n=1 Tax=Menopon gallinae TaxID=328185 RepID=A0AAW2HEH6_9NEOP